MQRRVALALSLVFTTLTTFGIIAVAAQAGMFSEHKAAQAAQPAAATGALTGAAPAQEAAPEDPLVVTDYLYVDETAVPVGIRVVRTAAPVAATPTSVASAAGDTASTATPGHPRPTATESARPTAAPPTEAPAASPTQVAPSATPKPAATATSAPSQAGMPREIEFVGSVTGISGDMVSFIHGGSSTTVRVLSQLSSLTLGTRAHVQAKLSGGIYVATEIEMGD